MKSIFVKISIGSMVAVSLLSSCSSILEDNTIKANFSSKGYFEKIYKNDKVPGMIVKLFDDKAKVICPEGFHVPNGYSGLHQPQDLGEFIVKNSSWTKGNTWNTMTILVYKGGKSDAARMKIDDDKVYNIWASEIAFFCVDDKLSNGKQAVYSVDWNNRSVT
ncbi:MAG: hypothetical protein ACI8TE_000792 [Francisella sp.]|jgi:hypothetical protein